MNACCCWRAGRVVTILFARLCLCLIHGYVVAPLGWEVSCKTRLSFLTILQGKDALVCYLIPKICMDYRKTCFGNLLACSQFLSIHLSVWLLKYVKKKINLTISMAKSRDRPPVRKFPASRNWRVHYCRHKNSQISVAHIFITSFSQISYNILPHLRPGLPSCLIPWDFLI